MRNTCPQCETLYAVTPADIGRRIACKNCRTALVVSEDGLTRDGDNPPSPPPPVAPSVPAPDAAPTIRRRLRAFFDLPTGLFTFGMVLTIVSLFGPLLDSSRVLGRQADLAEATSDYTRKSEDLKDAAQVKAREEFAKVKERWSAEVNAAKYDAARSQQSGQRGTVLGMVCLGLGCLGWISDPTATAMRHRVAVWLLISMMVLIFAAIAVQAVGATKSKLDG